MDVIKDLVDQLIKAYFAAQIDEAFVPMALKSVQAMTVCSRKALTEYARNTADMVTYSDGKLQSKALILHFVCSGIGTLRFGDDWEYAIGTSNVTVKRETRTNGRGPITDEIRAELNEKLGAFLNTLTKGGATAKPSPDNIEREKPMTDAEDEPRSGPRTNTTSDEHLD